MLISQNIKDVNPIYTKTTFLLSYVWKKIFQNHAIKSLNLFLK